jgi:hypothetical protein
MRIFLGFVIGLVLAIAIAFTAVKIAWGGLTNLEDRNRGDDVTRTIDVADFDRIRVAGVYEFDVTVGGDYMVTLSGREDDLARTTVGVEDGVLTLDTAERNADGKRKLVKHAITATISMPALRAIDAAGVVDGAVAGIDADAFEADISGVGELELSGRCDALDADVSGVGELDAENLLCRTVVVEVSGVGEAKVYASERVDAEIAGIGKIEISGSPPEVSKSQTSPLGRISVK